MPLFKTISLPESLIGVWQITETVQDLATYFSPEEMANPEFQKYSFEKRKAEWLVTRLLIKNLIGNDFTLTYLQTGKPILFHEIYKYISITHSRDFVAIFVHKKCEIGIDIESVNRDFGKVEKRYMSDEELRQTNGNQTLQCLYWCSKEAIFKLVKEDGIEFRQQIHITPFDYLKESQFTARFITETREMVYRLHFLALSDQVMVWVANSE